ncbi:MAG: N-acetyltransferase [Clostridia bacterium]|nr:N-acetyltransferase [Clostridia bacterium]
MIEVKPVQTPKEIKEFIEFPLKLYKGNPYFVPPLYGDEKKMFKKGFVYEDTCESVFFNAYKDGRICGRIQGILQKAANEKNNEKRVRFTRFDAIDDSKVAEKLFSAVENWALAKGMDTVVGPLGYSDLEREGLLIEGFDQLSTFEEQYNAEYYGRLIEGLGYKKEVDWVESRLRYPKEGFDERIFALEEKLLKRFKLHFSSAKNVNDFLDKYVDMFFELLDRSYADIYGTVPFTDGMKKMMIDNFKLIIDLRYVMVLLDENEKVVALGLCFPSIGEAVQKSGGRLTIPTLLRLIKAIKKPKSIDLGLIGVDPDLMNLGIGTAVVAELARILKNTGVEYAETNLNLEHNTAIRSMWKYFDSTEHKRRRSYVKKLI